MHAEDAKLQSGSNQHSSLAPGTAPPAAGNGARVGLRHRLPLWLLALGAGLIAGLMSWAGGEATFDIFKIPNAIVYPPNFKDIGGYQKVAVQAEIEGVARTVVERRRATMAFGLLGLLLGLALGLAGGVAAGSLHHALGGAVKGGAAGLIAGAVLSWILVPLFFRYFDPEAGLLLLFLTHVGIFAGVGIAAGLALGLGLGGGAMLSRALFGGLLGAILGTFALEAANSLAFPLLRTYEPVPSERVPRLVAHLCVSICTAVIAGLAAGTPPREEPTTLMR